MNNDCIQRAVYNSLTGNSAIMDLITGVYTVVPQPGEPEKNIDFPYLTILLNATTPFDTKTTFGTETLVQINIWSRSNNTIEAELISDKIWNAVHHQAMALPLGCSGQIFLVQVESANISLDPDGHTQNGLMRLRISASDI